MQVKYNMVVDFARPNKSNTILIAEDDANSRNCYFTLLADKKPFDMTGVTTATILGITSTGARVYADAEIHKDEEGNNINVISYLFPAALTDTAGNIVFTVTLADNTGARITSFEFYVKIRNALYNEDDFIDEDDMEGFRDLLARTRAALEKMEQMVQQDALPNPYPIRITVDNVEYEYNGADLVEIMMGEVAYLGPIVGTVDITSDDSSAAQAARSAARAEAALAETSAIVENFTDQIPTATVTKNTYTHQSTIVIKDKNGTTSAVVEDGVIGSSWYSGTDLVGEGTDITGAEGLEGDFYLNTATGKVYKCTASGTIATALWDYQLTMGANNFGRVKIGVTYVTANGDDTLELIAGDNITLVPNTADKTITIHSAGGGGGGGSSDGDMKKSVYDSNNDGIVNSADTISGLAASVAELNYLSGASSNIQNQINGKANAVHTHVVADITDFPTLPTDLADLNDDPLHRVVTDTQTTRWDGKQDALTAGTGITISGNTISVNSSGSAKGYKTVKVGSTDIDASVAEDTLEIEAGANITITPDAVGKKVTISSTGGGGGGSTGDMIKAVYDHNNDGIVNSADTLAGLTASIAELNYTDGVTSNIQDQIDGKADAVHTHVMADITDLDIPTTLAELTGDTTHRVVTDSEKATWNGKQNALTAGAGISIVGNTISASSAASSLDDLSDVDITGTPSQGQALIVNASGKFANTSLNIPTVNNGQLTIQQNGTNKATFTANQSGNATANIVTDDWVATGTVSGGAVSFSGIDDSGNYGYKPFAEVTASSTNKNPSAQISTLSGTGTSSMSVTYTTDADDGTTVKLRRIK